MVALISPDTLNRYSSGFLPVRVAGDEHDEPVVVWLHVKTHTWWVERGDGTFVELDLSAFDEEIRRGVDLLIELIVRSRHEEFMDSERVA